MHAPTATPTREAGLAEAHDVGLLTVRVPVTFPPLTAHALTSTPFPAAERKLSRAVLSGQAPEECGVGLRVGDTFLGFQLVEELGQGAFARVFLARQESLAGRPVALKVTLRPTKEAERLARLQHTNVVPVYSVHNALPVQVICMPYLGRRTVADVIRNYRDDNSVREPGGRRTSGTRAARSTNVADSSSAPKASADRPAARPTQVVPGDGPPLIGDPVAVLKVLGQLAAGLAHAHARGILHLDLKPANVLLPDSGEPMLLDFNLSFDTTTADRELVGGTVPYMATEQLLDLRTRGRGQIDARTDLYSLGVMAFEMLTGSVPFPASSRDLIDMDGLIEQRRQKPPSVRELNPAVTPAVESIIHKLLAPEPADRYQSAEELRIDVERHLANLPLLAAREKSIPERIEKWRRRNPRVPGRLAIALLVGLVAWMGAAVYERQDTQARTEAVSRARETLGSLDGVRLDLILPGDAKVRERGIARAERILGFYGLPDDERWMERPEVKRLPEAERSALASSLGELLLLVAQLRWQESESKAEVGGDAAVAVAMRLNKAAATCFAGAEAPKFIEHQAAELARTPAPPSAAGSGENAAMRDVFLEAAVALSSAKYSAALPLLVRFVNEQPGHGVAQYCLAYCKEQLGRHDSALERYEMAQSLLPQDPRAAFQRGVILGMRRQFADAEQAFSQAIELDAKLALAYRNRAFSRSSQEKLKEAEDDLTRALELGAAPLQIHTYRARIREKLGDLAGARADRALADSLKPTHEADFISRGLSQLDAKEYQAALADFQAAEELNRRSLSALLNQVHVLAERLREPEAALKVCERLIRAYPEYASGRIDRAVLLARLGKRLDAIAETERALKLSKDPDVTYRAACAYALASVVDESTKSADQARSLDLLHRAMRDGSARRDSLETDRDLDAIRQTERFQEISDAVMSLYR